MKPCQHCGEALENQATSCARCGGLWRDIGVRGGGPPKLAAREEPVQISLLGWLLQELAFILVFGGIGYLFAGVEGLVVGALMGFALVCFSLRV